MIKNIFILTLTFFTLLIYSQETTFQRNDNYDARDLKQTFNKKTDSLILESVNIIRQVDIFNSDFLKSFVVNDFVCKIDLSVLPIGEFIVQARMSRKRIIMYIVKNGIVNVEPPKPIKKEVLYFWVVNEVITGFGSNKTMSLENKPQVARLISKNKLDVATKIAKCNKLTVYEVYNSVAFTKKQLKKPTYFKSSNSKIFNVVPYYISKNTCIQ